MKTDFAVRGEFIPLDRLLKAAGVVGSGGEAHALVDAGQVRVDGQVETRRRAKLRPGQQLRCGDVCIELIADSGTETDADAK
ncbi:MAG: RNA-binding S4 domain-containing protein [Rhodocyclaceae bacterium]